MKITVIGASRGIGRKVVDHALSRGHGVRALARGADTMGIEADGFEPVAGDATDPVALARAVAGADAVILTLGVPRDLRALRRTTLFSDATSALIPVMEAAGVRRLLAVTGFGAGDSAAKLSSLEKIPFKLFLGRAYADKALQEEMIRASSLDWTIVRPGILNDNAMSKKYKVLVEPETWRQGIVSRADVAHFLVQAAEDGSHIGKTPAIQR
ncbi:NAD(P)-dependent oxidoreductase [Roseicyclus mahoneyensis]|jgi:putative NADH-flavin reductase|uniref:Putative NADH-flavin reductase n=1 Tax=Roseicyclus mahoneyensis TaxID=164332 RepID=A0A316GXP9_9RHOB|nr:NAD(P)H-binding protein [Roseicyclus mahoneyensis]PWK59873.1 putative NADH-flavin reductase [Roseicyclus mahoneyensis]